jgi:hypothetical protein
MCIFNAEAQAVIEAIKATRRWAIVKKNCDKGPP